MKRLTPILIVALLLTGLGAATPLTASAADAAPSFATVGPLTDCGGVSRDAQPGTLTLSPDGAFALAVGTPGTGQVLIQSAQIAHERGVVGSLACGSRTATILTSVSYLSCQDAASPVVSVTSWGVTPEGDLLSVAYQATAAGAGPALCTPPDGVDCAALFSDFAVGNALITPTGALPTGFIPGPGGAPNLYTFTQYHFCYSQKTPQFAATHILNKYYYKRPAGNPTVGAPCHLTEITAAPRTEAATGECVPGTPDTLAFTKSFSKGGGGHPTTFDIYAIADIGGNNPEDADPCHTDDVVAGANQIDDNTGLPLAGIVNCTSANLSQGGSHDMCNVIAYNAGKWINDHSPSNYGMGWTDTGDHNGCQNSSYGGRGCAGTEDTDHWNDPDWDNNMIAQHEISHIFGAIDEGTWTDSVMGYWGAYWDEMWYYQNDLDAITNYFS